MIFKCTNCSECFTRIQNLNRHIKEVHLGELIQHYTCSENNEHVHNKSCNFNLPPEEMDGFKRILTAQAFDGLARNIRFYYMDKSLPLLLPSEFLYGVRQFVINTLNRIKKEYGHKKICTKLCVEFIKESREVTVRESYFSVNAHQIESYDFDFVIKNLLEKIHQFEDRGRNWKIRRTLFLELGIVKY